MTRTIGLILIAIFFNISITQAKLIATITNTASGGIVGNESSIKPLIAYKGEDPIFSDFRISSDEEGMSFSLSSDLDDPNFSKFIKRLTNSHDEYLKVGHKIGMIKSDVGSLESSWFDDKYGFEGKTITRIELTYTKIKFSTPLTNIKDMDWTNFTYEVKLSFYDDTTPDVTFPAAFDDSSMEPEDFQQGFIEKGGNEEVELDEETKLDATEDYMIVVNKRRPKRKDKKPTTEVTENQAKIILKAIYAHWNYAF